VIHDMKEEGYTVAELHELLGKVVAGRWWWSRDHAWRDLECLSVVRTGESN